MSIPDRIRSLAQQALVRGSTLIELLVGLLVGLFVILAALGTLVTARATSGTVSEITQIQQQASFALRVIGMQIRQAGSIDIRRNEALGLYLFSNAYPGQDANRASVKGEDGSKSATDSMSISHQPDGYVPAQFSDCLGDPLDGSIDNLISTISVRDGELRCLSSKSANQGARGLARNVSDLQFLYRVIDGNSTRQMTASAVEAAKLWSRVRAVEVCLDLVGDIVDAGAASGTYRNCHDTETSRNGRTHVVMRNVITLHAHEN